MKFKDFYDEVITSLGGELMDVELSEKDIRLCFNKAKRTFQQKGHNSYRKKFMRLNVDPCQKHYTLPNDINTVVKVIRPDSLFGGEDEFYVSMYDQLFNKYSNYVDSGDWLSYDFTLQLIEQYRRYLAFDVMFHFDEISNIFIPNRMPRTKEVWLLEVYCNLNDEEYMDVLWIQSWALAEAKMILGNAYRKFSQIPGPDGVINLDGNGLIQEGMQEKERLLEDILNGVDGAIDYYPITIG